MCRLLLSVVVSHSTQSNKSRQIIMVEEFTVSTKGAVEGTQDEDLMAFSQCAIMVST